LVVAALTVQPGERVIFLINEIQLPSIRRTLESINFTMINEQVDRSNLQSLYRRLKRYRQRGGICFIYLTITGELSPHELNSLIRRHVVNTSIRLVILFSNQLFYNLQLTVCSSPRSSSSL
jgi:hypothetical protein